MIPQLAAIAVATLASEDLTCIATGALIAGRMLGFFEGTLACLFGIFVGDLMLFFTGRIFGAAALRWKPLARFLSAERLAQAQAWMAQRGLSVVLLSRFTPGLRLPTYFAAGVVRAQPWRFAGFFLIAAAVWTPLLVGGTALLGAPASRTLVDHGWLISITVFALAVAIHKLIRAIPRWEFWPIWAAYLPLAPYLGWLAVRHRSLTLFTAANPGILSGGFAGESKSEILATLSAAEGFVADFERISSILTVRGRIAKALDFMNRLNLNWPVVLKPDVGERGSNVAIVRSLAEMEAYLATTHVDCIVQRLVEGPEFGIFYVRYPDQARGRIFSITEKRLPEVTGDGHSTIEALIRDDRRASLIVETYRRACLRPLTDIPDAGERVRIAELGTHSRGAIFLDGGHLVTSALEAAVDRVSQTHPGFHIGRYDVRAASIEALQRGEFQVIELNGVSAEPTHIYDPAVTLCQAYAAMRAQWRMAFEIGAMNRAQGVQPMGLSDLIALLRARQTSPPSSSSFPDQRRAARTAM
jgi:membrane protein DedA with SNARE-associated domain